MFVKGTPYYQSYDSNGRIFQTLGALRTFITSVMASDSAYNRDSSRQKNRVSEWEVVEFEMTVKEVKGIHEVITAKKLKELLMK